MKKRIVLFSIVSIMIFCLVACGSDTKPNTEANNNTVTKAETNQITDKVEPTAEPITDQVTPTEEVAENTPIPTEEVKVDEVTPTEELFIPVDPLEVLKQELEEKYDVTTPSKFVRGDATGKWRIVKVANGTAPSDYAVDYARAYMEEGDIHFIVNFSLNTTTRFKIVFGNLEVRTTEYVSKEEHDASIIGDGQLYSEEYYNMETGEKITVEVDESAGTVDADALIAKVKEVVPGGIGAGEAIKDVSFDGTNLTIKVDMSGADPKYFTLKELAESRIDSITQEILDLGDEYYNTWEKITLDFGSEGVAVLDKSMVKDEGLGKYFNYPAGILG